MEGFEKKLESKIDDSLFLDTKKKMDLKPMLKTLSTKEKRDLGSILDSEKKNLSEIIQTHLEQHGTEGIQNIDQAISAAKKKMSKEKEILSQEEDTKLMAKLEQQLEDLDQESKQK